MPPQPSSVEIGSQAVKGEGRIRRCNLSPDELVTTPHKDIRVVADVLPYVTAKYGSMDGFGYRDIIDTVKEEKEVTKVVGGKEVKETKTWNYFTLGEYQWWTYDQFAALVKDAQGGLIKAGCSNKTVFNLYAATSPRWQVMANACAAQGIVFATAYDSLGEEGLSHSINEPESTGLYTNANLLGTLASVVGSTPSLKFVVYDGKESDIAKGALDKIRAANDGIEVLHFDEFLKSGKENPVAPNPAGPDDTLAIMYTSGSTGAPKGVVITNGNVVACLGAVQMVLGHVVKHGETYIAFLPLAHIMEFAVEMCFMFVGAKIGYGTVKTLTDASVRNCSGDLNALQPTIMVGVPAIWETIRKGIVSKVQAGGALKSKVFNLAMAAKKLGGTGSILGNIADSVVFKNVKSATGGKLKYALNGGAPISLATHEFLVNALVTIIQGYGMTESTAMAALLPPSIFDYGTVGCPVPSAELKLVDVPEAGYKSTNSPPQGELWIRGPSVTKGYYKREDLTKEAWTEDGWFKTGDVAQWNKNGTLSIIDRVKNLVKLAGGEYIAVERLESVYKGSNLVGNLMVHASSDANRPMAVVFPHEANVKAKASELGISSTDLSSLCHNDQIRDAILKDVNATGKKAGFKPLEVLQTVVLSDEEWTPHNNLLTAAQKLNRKAILQKYKEEVDAVYP
ncbi:uncharacterized protein JCM15063_000709 [Sporobolomyces koalae]|uniref:uncharacterized protein n=1 Tax=Sporobolomyces koalae TaxID=500713 RepID=UPI003174C11D